jgi:hypothetical protein
LARYWVGGGSSTNWDATGNTNWGTQSNTRDNASVPGINDDVIFDGVGTGASDSVQNIAVTIKSLTMTGYANTLTNNAYLSCTGSVLLSPDMTLLTGSNGSLTFTGSNQDITLKTFSKAFRGVSCGIAFTGKVTLTGDFIQPSSGLSVLRGTFDANDYNIDVKVVSFSNSASYTPTIYMGNGTWTVRVASGASAWYIPYPAIIHCENSTIYFIGVTSTSFFSFGYTYNIVKTKAAADSNTGFIQFQNNATIKELIVESGIVKFTDGITITVDKLTVTAPVGKFSTLTGTSTGGWSIASPCDTSTVSSCKIYYSRAYGGAVWNAWDGTNTDGGNNTGWLFVKPPTLGNFFLIFKVLG